MAARPAVAYATLATLAGSAAAVWLAQGLVGRFSGKGIVAPELVGTPALALAVAAAAAGTVLLATWRSLPISTTHALVGGLAGVGLASGTLRGAALAAAFVAPLLLSPLLALLATAVVYPLLRRARLAMGIDHATCVCIGAEPVAALVPAIGARAAGAGSTVPPRATVAAPVVALRVYAGSTPACAGYVGTVAGIGVQRLLDAAHLATAGAVSFARGLNDTPKIAAMLLVAGPLVADQATPVVLVGVAMAVGGLLLTHRIAGTMGFGITTLDDGQAFTANATTAALVIFASQLGLPVSTTHTSCGALFGIGAVRGGARWSMIATIVLSWAATLPVAAAIAAATWALLG
jgi:PiT family inorganic phosphate transporter